MVWKIVLHISEVINMADKLTIKQEKYAQGLFSGLSQRAAYKQAYDAENMTDKQIDEEACKLAATPKVSQRVEQLVNELADRNMVTKEKVLAELAHIAFDDISNYLEFYTDGNGNVMTRVKDSTTIDTRAISEVSQGKDGQFRFKVYCKDNALVQLGKHLGMFVDKVESKNINLNANADIPDDPEELKKLVDSLNNELGTK